MRLYSLPVRQAIWHNRGTWDGSGIVPDDWEVGLPLTLTPEISITPEPDGVGGRYTNPETMQSTDVYPTETYLEQRLKTYRGTREYLPNYGSNITDLIGETNNQELREKLNARLLDIYDSFNVEIM